MTKLSPFYIYYAGFIQLMNEETCLRVSRITRDRLAKIGGKDQTFDQIVNGLIEKSNSGENQIDE